MGDDRIRLREAKQLHNLPVLYLVHPDLPNAILHVLHIDQMLPIEVKWHTVLRESHVIRSVLHEHVFFEVTDADRVEVRQWLFGRVARYVDRQDTVVLLV